MYKQVTVYIEPEDRFFSTKFPEARKVFRDAAEAIGRLFTKEEFLPLARRVECIIDKVKTMYEDILLTEKLKDKDIIKVWFTISMSDDLKRFRIIFRKLMPYSLSVIITAYETDGFVDQVNSYKESVLKKYGFFKELEKSEDRLVRVSCNGITKDITFKEYKQMKKELKYLSDCNYTEIE